MEKLVKRESGPPFQHGRRVAVRFMRGDQYVLTALLSLFGSVQISPYRDNPQQLMAYGLWVGPLNELDAQLKQIKAVGLALVGLVEEEADQPATATAVQPWRIAVRFHMKNGPLFIYLTNLLTSIRVEPIPYSDYLWVEGTFRGSLDVFESSLRELKAEELIVLNRGEESIGTVNEQVSSPATFPEPPKPAAALPAPASILDRSQQYRQSPVIARTGRVTRWPQVVVGLLVVLIVGGVVARLDSVTKFFNPRQIVPPAAVDPQTVPWAQTIHSRHFDSWIGIQRQNGWSNEQMEQFLTKLRALETDYTQYPSIVARSVKLLGFQKVRTPQEFLPLVRSLKLRVVNRWPFPDQPANAYLTSDSVDFNFSVVTFYEVLAEQPAVLGWLLEHVGRQAG